MASLFNFPLILALFLLSQFSVINGHYEDEGIPADLNERGLIVVKIWCLMIIFLATFVCGLIPYFFRSKTESFLVLGNQFAGGVFFAISMHFLADSADVMDDFTEGSSVIPFLFVLIGYVLILFVESIVFKIKSNYKDAIIQVEEGRKTEECASDHNISPILVKRAAVEVSILLILGLALHSAFEGITIGLAERDRYAWRYLWTISIHKVFLAVALGIAVLRMQPNRTFLTSVAYSFAFAVSTPIGVIIALIIKETAQSDTADWVYALTQGIACGVFLHVSIYHLLAKGFNPQDQCSYKTPFRRFFALFFGVAGITIGLIFD